MIARTDAIRLARIERDSLRMRARAGGPCAPAWRRAAEQASRVVRDLEARRDRRAMQRALAIGPLWHKAAACGPTSLGADEGTFDIEAALKKQGETLASIQKMSEEQLLFRKIATVAAVAGAAFAMLRLTEIWLAVQERRERRRPVGQ